MKDYIDSLFQFIENSPTCYQAVEQIKQRLAENGYRSLDEKTPWQIDAGGRYYVTRNDSSLIAFAIPGMKGAAAMNGMESSCRR